jgi:hypothetical protein
VGQVVNEWLGLPEFSHFCLPTCKGATGTRDTNRPNGSLTEISPSNLGEAVVLKWRDESASRPKSLHAAIGLKRNR